MALTNRYKTAPDAGTLAALILVLVFGSPWYRDWVTDNTDQDTAGGWFLRLLAWPAWRFDSDDSLQDMLADDLRAILVVVFTAVFLYLLRRHPARPGPRHAQPVLRRLGRVHLRRRASPH